MGRFLSFGFLFLSLYASLAFSADPGEVAPPPELTPAEVKEVELATAVQTVLFQIDKSINAAADAGQLISDAQWENAVKTSAQRILDLYTAGLPAYQSVELKSKFSLFNWGLIGSYAKRIFNEGKKLAKANGVVWAVSEVLGTVLGYAVPMACLAAKMPALVVGAAWVFPFRPLIFGAGLAVEQQLLKKKLIKLYGSKAEYERVMQGYKHAREELFLRGGGDVIAPLFKDGKAEEGVVLSDWFIHTRTFEKLGMSRERLTFPALMKFLADNKYKDAYIDAIEAQKKLPTKYKAAMILQHLMSRENPLLEKLRERYGNSFVAVSESPHRDAVLEWARSFKDVKTLPEAYERIGHAPKGVPAHVIARVWRDGILPVLQENFEDIWWWKTKKLARAFDDILVDADRHPNVTWNETWTERTRGYLAKISSLPICRQNFGDMAHAI